MTSEPTPRELLIQLQNLAAQVAALVGRVDDLTRTLSDTYVPRGEYDEARKGDDRRMSEIEKDIETQAGFRRSITGGALLLLLGLIANLVVTLARIPGAGS